MNCEKLIGKTFWFLPGGYDYDLGEFPYAPVQGRVERAPHDGVSSLWIVSADGARRERCGGVANLLANLGERGPHFEPRCWRDMMHPVFETREDAMTVYHIIAKECLEELERRATDAQADLQKCKEMYETECNRQ